MDSYQLFRQMCLKGANGSNIHLVNSILGRLLNTRNTIIYLNSKGNLTEKEKTIYKENMKVFTHSFNRLLTLPGVSFSKEQLLQQKET